MGSPAEAEIYATKEVVREAQGINWVMRDLGMTGLNLGTSNQDGVVRVTQWVPYSSSGGQYASTFIPER